VPLLSQMDRYVPSMHFNPAWMLILLGLGMCACQHVSDSISSFTAQQGFHTL
jgi:hypothetical protein